MECCGFTVSDGRKVLAHSGDTGPTDRLWKVLDSTEGLAALLMQVSFPNEQARLARASGHHTPETMARDVKKMASAKQLPILIYRIKPSFRAKVERECARVRGLNLTVCAIGDQFIL